MSGVCREVITLQLGHYSNFVGTHWWNLQDASLSHDPDSAPAEIQSDAVFREGQTLGGKVTYTPRLICMDLKGSLRTLRQEGRLYDPGEGGVSAVTWDGGVSVHEQSRPEKNRFLQDLDELDKGEVLAKADFCSASKRPGAESFSRRLPRFQRSYRLERSVSVWSDFLRPPLHPRTVTVVHQFNHHGEADRLEFFGQGQSVLQGALLEELEDRLHFFVEECDYLQGFQVFCDLADGFSGLGSKVTELLRDSYGGRGILTWGAAPVGPRDSNPARDRYQLLNCCLGMVDMAAHSSLFCPLTLRGGLGRKPPSPPHFPLLSHDPSLWYHSSAVLALALDAITAPYRLRGDGVPMWQLADSLAVSGRKVVAAYGAVPFPMASGGALPDALSACSDTLPWKPMSACPEAVGGCCYGQWTTLRGFKDQKLVSCPSPGIKPPTPLHGLHSGEDVLAAYVSSFYPSAPLALRLVSSPSKLAPPFPQIFSPTLDARGFMRSEAPPAGAPAPVLSSVPVLASLQSAAALHPWLSELHRAAAAVDVAPGFLSPGLEMSEYQEALEELRLLAHRYHDDSGGVTRSSSEDED